MDYPVVPLRGPLEGSLTVPPSKSLHQRALALSALCARPVRIDTAPGARPPGEDAQLFADAVERLGHWTDGALGTSRETLTLDLGEGGTGFRFSIALATLRPDGARTLVRGRPALLRRPHRPLLRSLRRLGAHVKRRRSGAVRVIGGGLRGGGELTVDVSRSSQFASALLLIAPRIGGLTVRIGGSCVSSFPYLYLTYAMLKRFGVPAVRLGPGADAPMRVEASGLDKEAVRIEPDASAAAAWWAAAALCGGEAVVQGLSYKTLQADRDFWPWLALMGAHVWRDDAGDTHVEGNGERLRAPGIDVDLRGSPDLMFLVGVLAATADGETVIRGVSHTRGKESDRIAVLARGLKALGCDIRVGDGDAIRVRGGELHGGRVDCGGDHRAAIAFGVLGLKIPGIVLGGAEVVAKSQPGFLGDLAALATEHSAP